MLLAEQMKIQFSLMILNQNYFISKNRIKYLKTLLHY